MIPKSIISSFNKEAKCYLPNGESTIKRGITLAFEQFDVPMRIRIEEKK